MPVKFVLEGTDLRKQYNEAATRNARRVADSMRAALNRCEDEIEREWQKDLQKASPAFAVSQRWRDALQMQITPPVGRTAKLTLTVGINIFYWRVHEYGATIFGRPMLWIPLSWTGIKMRARDWGRRYGGLFRVDREGKNPLLLSRATKEPRYVGVTSVTLRRRLHLRRIIATAAKNLGKYYRSEYRKRKGQ